MHVREIVKRQRVVTFGLMRVEENGMAWQEPVLCSETRPRRSRTEGGSRAPEIVAISPNRQAEAKVVVLSLNEGRVTHKNTTFAPRDL